MFKSASKFLSSAFLILALGSLPASLHAFTWTGGGDGVSWAQGTNWQGGVAPNDSSAEVTIRPTLTEDLTINVPAGITDVRWINIGDQGGTYTITLQGADATSTFRSSQGGNSTVIELFDDSTVDFDIGFSFSSVNPRIDGQGLLIVSGVFTNTSNAWQIRNNGTTGTLKTVRILGEMNANSQQISMAVGQALEIGNDDFSNLTIRLNRETRVSAFGADRTISNDFDLTNGREIVFDGSHSLTINGNATFSTPGGTGVGTPHLTIDTGTFAFNGSNSFDVSGTDASNVRDFNRHPFRFANDGTMVLGGEGTVADKSFSDIDLHFDGQGTLMLSNTTGSATGSGNQLVIGRSEQTAANTAVTLAGDGATASEVVIAGGSRIAPGNSVGTLSVGGLALEDLSEVFFTVLADGSHALLEINGDFTFEAASLMTLTIVDAHYFTGPTTLVTYSGNLFSDLYDPNIEGSSPFFFENFTLPAGLSIDYGTGFNSAITIVPEPATVAFLLGLSGLGLALWRRRTRVNR